MYVICPSSPWTREQTRPAGQMRPAADFCTTCGLKMAFTFFPWLKQNQKRITLHDPLKPKYIQISLHLKIYLNVDMLVHLWPFFYYISRAEELRQRPYGLQSQKYPLSAPLQETFAYPWSRESVKKWTTKHGISLSSQCYLYEKNWEKCKCSPSM